VLLHPIDRRTAGRFRQPAVAGVSLEDTAARCIESLTGRASFSSSSCTPTRTRRQSEGSLISGSTTPCWPPPRPEREISKSQASWFPVMTPRPAWDHDEILAYALRLCVQTGVHRRGFELLPDTFIERASILMSDPGGKARQRNFRRRILEAGIIEPTSNRRGGEGRPAQLYHYRPTQWRRSKPALIPLNLRNFFFRLTVRAKINIAAKVRLPGNAPRSAGTAGSAFCWIVCGVPPGLPNILFGVATALFGHLPQVCFTLSNRSVFSNSVRPHFDFG